MGFHWVSDSSHRGHNKDGKKSLWPRPGQHEEEDSRTEGAMVLGPSKPGLSVDSKFWPLPRMAEPPCWRATPVWRSCQSSQPQCRQPLLPHSPPNPPLPENNQLEISDANSNQPILALPEQEHGDGWWGSFRGCRALWPQQWSPGTLWPPKKTKGLRPGIVTSSGDQATGRDVTGFPGPSPVSPPSYVTSTTVLVCPATLCAQDI